jgi:FkbM family methyltransferase
MKIFDIGANNGQFTDKCIETHKDLTMITIEANPYLIDHLKLKYNNNNIIILNNLISEKDNEEIDFYISNVNTISTASIEWITESRFTGSYFWYQPLKIKSRSLDSLIEEYGVPDLIKIDVEGYEFEVIKGLSKRSCEICFEWAEEQYTNIIKIINHLKNIGYKNFGYILGDEHLKRPEEFTSWENLNFEKNILSGRKETWGMIWAN